MSKIEYKYEHFLGEGSLKSHNKHYIEWLNWKGEEGWKLVYAEKVSSHEYLFILIRETDS